MIDEGRITRRCSEVELYRYNCGAISLGETAEKRLKAVVLKVGFVKHSQEIHSLKINK